jgi:hypothetical protein
MPAGRILPCGEIAEKPLLDGTGYVREDVIGIRTDQPDRAHDDDQNNGQHDGVFGDILTALVLYQLLPNVL